MCGISSRIEMSSIHFFENLIVFELFTKKKLLKIEGIFHGGLKNINFYIWQDWSSDTAS